MNTTKKVLLTLAIVAGTFPMPAHAETGNKPILVIDRCPQFCPKPPKPPILVIDRCPQFCPGWRPPVEICAQVLIPVPGRPGYWYTDSCRKTIIGGPDKPKKCLYGVINGRGYMPTRECMLELEKEKNK
jgi:hypothetical protein